MNDCQKNPCELCLNREAFAEAGRCYDCEVLGTCEDHDDGTCSCCGSDDTDTLTTLLRCDDCGHVRL